MKIIRTVHHKQIFCLSLLTLSKTNCNLKVLFDNLVTNESITDLELQNLPENFGQYSLEDYNSGVWAIY